jgi:hypothetical protein
MTPKNKVRLISAVIIVALIAVVGLAAKNTGKPTVTEAAISRTFLPQAPCVTIDIALALSKNADAADAAAKMFEVLQSTAGVSNATVYRDEQRMSVGFCESSTSEEAIREALAPTGFVAPSPN